MLIRTWLFYCLLYIPHAQTIPNEIIKRVAPNNSNTSNANTCSSRTTDGDAVRAEILKTHKQRSVPAVFVKGKFVGGCNDGPEPWMGALPLLNSGKIEEMLGA